MLSASEPVKFCIAICSRGRPEMLRNALISLTNLNIPENVTLSVALIENNDTPEYAAIANEFQSILNLSYTSEPRAGLTYARNKALDTLIDLDIDWMGSVDDDQHIDKNWLIHMVSAIRKYPDTKMFVGDWQRIIPDSVPYWYPVLNPPRNYPTGKLLPEGVSSNTCFHRSVFYPDNMAIRFDPSYNFLGGEDGDFSMQYLKKGGKIRYVAEAITEEEVHGTRQTLRNRLGRAHAIAYILTKLRHKHKPLVVALLWTLQITYRTTALGIINMFLAGIALPFREQWAMRRFGESLKFFWQAGGVLHFYFGRKIEQYREVEGN